jgi:hypothetical protein
MLRHVRASMLAAALFALAACNDPTGPQQTPDLETAASALRVGTRGGKVGIDPGAPQDGAARRLGAQGGAAAGKPPIDPTAPGFGAQGGKIGGDPTAPHSGASRHISSEGAAAGGVVNGPTA